MPIILFPLFTLLVWYKSFIGLSSQSLSFLLESDLFVCLILTPSDVGSMGEDEAVTLSQLSFIDFPYLLSTVAGEENIVGGGGGGERD